MSRRRYKPEDLVRDCAERQVGLMLPLPINDKLDQMVANVEEIGAGRTYRKDIVAGLVAFASADGESLFSMLRRYRRAKVDDVLPSGVPMEAPRSPLSLTDEAVQRTSSAIFGSKHRLGVWLTIGRKTTEEAWYSLNIASDLGGLAPSVIHPFVKELEDMNQIKRETPTIPTSKPRTPYHRLDTELWRTGTGFLEHLVELSSVQSHIE